MVGKIILKCNIVRICLILFCPYTQFLEISSIILMNEINRLIKPMSQFERRLQLSIKIERQ